MKTEGSTPDRAGLAKHSVAKHSDKLIIFDRHRLGEILVLRGALSTHDLRRALREQKERPAPLGRILVEQGLVTKHSLYKTLCHQWAMRAMAAAIGLLITFSGTGAQAAPIKDMPPQASLVSAANAVFTPLRAYPSLFGSEERRSGNIDPFTKWSGMFDRFQASMSDSRNRSVVDRWMNELQPMAGLPLDAMAQRVNAMMNARPYIGDNRNWGQSDYWATPVEFLTRGGDCEDYAIAKYASLRALGVPEERLRIAIVHDEVKDMPHAVLIVYTDGAALILDNQSKQVKNSAYVSRYRPIFSINRQAWWLHTAPGPTVVASR